jgi:predicted outer membrane repeat protein
VTIRFINNTAGEDGAAIRATSIDRCTYTPSYNASEDATEFEKSIFQLSPQFTFRYPYATYTILREVHQL